MSWLMASVYDWFMQDMERACGDAWRREILAPLRGDVLEVGAGTGRNLDHYAAIDRLVLAEPDAHMRKKLESRLPCPHAAKRIDVVSWSAERLDARDAAFDHVVSTLVLCSVGDVARTLAEIRRVLRPSGTLVFLEHVAADAPGRRAWQRRIEPAWKHVAGNCHLTRDTAKAIEEAGFRLASLTRESARKALPIVRPMIRGTAMPVAGT